MCLESVFQGVSIRPAVQHMVQVAEILIRHKASCADPEGRGGQDPLTLKNHKTIEFITSTGPDPLKKSQSYQGSVQS